MEFKRNTPRNTVTIAGKQLTVPVCFTEGHTCNANEAAALQQTFQENIRNNTAKKIQELGEDGDPQAVVDQYAAQYEFGVRRGGGRIGDPVEAKARELARKAISKSMQEKGIKLKDVDPEHMNNLITAALEKNPHLRERAAQIIEMQQQAVVGLEDVAA